jgi:hypothetical protein
MEVSIKGVFVKTLDNVEEVKQLDLFRREYWDADLELPHDFKTADGAVDTVVATKNGQIVSSLTGIRSIVLDPLIKNPDADPTDILYGLIKQETALTFNAQKFGAVDSYVAIPRQLEKYAHLLENYGYTRTVENCIVMRRPLRPDTVALIGPEREALLKEAKKRKDEEKRLK